jgi:hypothetical protein
MTLKKVISEKSSEIEKLLIVGIVGIVFISLFIDAIAEARDIILIILQFLLITFYIILLNNKIYALFWLGFLSGIFSYFFSSSLPSLLYFFLNSVSFILFGVLILIRTFKLSIENRNFELLSFIMGFLLLLQAAFPFFNLKPEVMTFYSFALSFSLGTIIYNDNLWHRFSSDEKNIIKYILIVSLVLVIQSSARYINL